MKLHRIFTTHGTRFAYKGGRFAPLGHVLTVFRKARPEDAKELDDLLDEIAASWQSANPWRGRWVELGFIVAHLFRQAILARRKRLAALAAKDEAREVRRNRSERAMRERRAHALAGAYA